MGCVFCEMIEGATLDIKLLNPKAVAPSKRKEDSGYDVYGIFEEGSSLYLGQGENAIISTGIAMQIPQGLGFAIKNRSSNGIKGAIVGAELVDSGYRGEVHIDIHNISNKTIVITDSPKDICDEDVTILNSKDALIQGVIIPTLDLPVRIREELDPSEREEGKFGSTNKTK